MCFVWLIMAEQARNRRNSLEIYKTNTFYDNLLRFSVMQNRCSEAPPVEIHKSRSVVDACFLLYVFQSDQQSSRTKACS